MRRTKTEDMEVLFNAAIEREEHPVNWRLSYSRYEDLFTRTKFFSLKDLLVASGLIEKVGYGKYLRICGED